MRRHWKLIAAAIAIAGVVVLLATGALPDLPGRQGGHRRPRRGARPLDLPAGGRARLPRDRRVRWARCAGRDDGDRGRGNRRAGRGQPAGPDRHHVGVLRARGHHELLPRPAPRPRLHPQARLDGAAQRGALGPGRVLLRAPRWQDDPDRPVRGPRARGRAVRRRVLGARLRALHSLQHHRLRAVVEHLHRPGVHLLPVLRPRGLDRREGHVRVRSHGRAGGRRRIRVPAAAARRGPAPAGGLDRGQARVRADLAWGAGAGRASGRPAAAVLGAAAHARRARTGVHDRAVGRGGGPVRVRALRRAALGCRSSRPRPPTASCSMWPTSCARTWAWTWSRWSPTSAPSPRSRPCWWPWVCCWRLAGTGPSSVGCWSGARSSTRASSWPSRGSTARGPPTRAWTPRAPASPAVTPPTPPSGWAWRWPPRRCSPASASGRRS